MATNPFEDEDANYFVLINDEGQHSLWPVFADVPDGWEIIFGEDKRQACLDFIEKNWTDMRPKSLIRQMEADAAERQNAPTKNGDSGNGTSGNGSKAAKKKAQVAEK
jgi:MbtH protein